MSENVEKTVNDKELQRTKKDEIGLFIENYFKCFSPILGLCSTTDRPIITYIFDNKQYTRYIERLDYQRLIMKMMHETGFSTDQLLHASEKVINMFVGMAVASERKLDIFRRNGNFEGDIYINLGDKDGNFIGITEEGWRKTNRAPIHFITSPKDTPLPDPICCELNDFLPIWNNLFNFKDQNSSYIALAFTIKAMMPGSGANPILVIEGVQGSGKTTISTVFKKLIDPTTPAVFSPPAHGKDLLIMANSSYLIVIDNSSGLSPQMSDELCRMSTGVGMILRVLYQTDEERVYNLCKPIIINGIEELTDRADFVERALILYLNPIKSDTRISESHFWESFNENYPKLLGGLYSLISHVLKVLPSIQNKNLVRMTEFNRIGLALDKAFNNPDGYFSDVLKEHQDQKISSIFDSDMFCQLIKEALERSGNLEGSASQLMKKIYRNQSDKIPNNILPRDPRKFKGKHQRLKPVLEKNGIEWGDLERSSNCRGIYIRKL